MPKKPRQCYVTFHNAMFNQTLTIVISGGAAGAFSAVVVGSFLLWGTKVHAVTWLALYQVSYHL